MRVSLYGGPDDGWTGDMSGEIQTPTAVRVFGSSSIYVLWGDSPERAIYVWSHADPEARR
jgi:hypothetical protein